MDECLCIECCLTYLFMYFNSFLVRTIDYEIDFWIFCQRELSDEDSVLRLCYSFKMFLFLNHPKSALSLRTIFQGIILRVDPRFPLLFLPFCSSLFTHCDVWNWQLHHYFILDKIGQRGIYLKAVTMSSYFRSKLGSHFVFCGHL